MKKDVAIIIHEGVQALDVAGPIDVFSEANGFLPADEGYQCFLVANSNAPIHASSGMPMLAHLTFDEAARRFHTVLVAGGPFLPDAAEDTAMSTWLRAWGAKAIRYGSVCTGAFALGHAGLLDGQTCTTHWQNAGKLAEMFPAARVELDRIFSRDGALVTSAGVTAGIDLSLALVREDFNDEVTLACAKRLVVVAQRQGGQSQFSPLLMLTNQENSPLNKMQSYVLAHLSEAFSAERLADIAGTSVRSMARIFEKELSITPHEFVESIRIDKARNLLEASDMSLKTIAFTCGFSSPEQMRNAFQRRLSLNPLRYRENFKATVKLADAAS